MSAAQAKKRTKKRKKTIAELEAERMRLSARIKKAWEVELKKIGPMVKKVRRKSSLSQEDLADCVGVTRSSIANLESGRQRPSLMTLVRIGSVLGLELGFLDPDKR